MYIFDATSRRFFFFKLDHQISSFSPVTEKLDLAKRIHTSSIFIPRKHQFLLDWLCSALLRDPDRLRFLEKRYLSLIAYRRAFISLQPPKRVTCNKSVAPLSSRLGALGRAAR